MLIKRTLAANQLTHLSVSHCTFRPDNLGQPVPSQTGQPGRKPSNSGATHSPGNKMTSPQPPLRRSWKYNLDPTNDVLISTEMTTGSVHVHLPLPSSTAHFYLQPSTTAQELPLNSYPVSCWPRLTSLKISRRQEGVITPTASEPQENFEDFLYSQDPWILDLLRHLEFKVSFDEAITSLTAPQTFGIQSRF
jgi:hypothetical protein